MSDRFFRFDLGEPIEISREEAGYDFVYGCKPGVTRVSPEAPPLNFTIHCDGPYFPGALERLQDVLNAETKTEDTPTYYAIEDDDVLWWPSRKDGWPVVGYDHA